MNVVTKEKRTTFIKVQTANKQWSILVRSQAVAILVKLYLVKAQTANNLVEL